jgi:hypothetical protein
LFVVAIAEGEEAFIVLYFHGGGTCRRDLLPVGGHLTLGASIRTKDGADPLFSYDARGRRRPAGREPAGMTSM